MQLIQDGHRYKMESEAGGNRLLLTRLSDGATLFLQDEAAETLLNDWGNIDNEADPEDARAEFDAIIAQYDENFTASVSHDERCP